MNDASKVVGMDGNAIEPRSETPVGIRNLLAEALVSTEGRTFVAVAYAMVDSTGAVVTDRFWVQGHAHTLLGGVVQLQHELLRTFDES